jgi:diguanylate cyclase (GGDEF)-like protein
MTDDPVVQSQHDPAAEENPASMQYADLVDLLEHIGKDPSRLIFEDELTGIHNRRFLLSYLEHKIRWERDDDYPLSLLMIDLDQFKQINDTHGHDTGDQALTWMATLVKEVGGEQGLPVRYGGDEFMLLLPKSSRREAREMADRLLQRCRDRPFRLRDADLTVPINMSIGFATAPEDATNAKELFQAADTALFHAKQSGRNQAASAAEIDPEKVFQKTALYRLRATGIAGRDEEMGVVSEALQAVSRGENHFLVIEAGPGMGKTTFVDAVRRNLAGDDTFCTVKVVGDQQEAYRPYYLASRILVAMLNQRDDKGLELVKELAKDEVGYLARVLPQFGDEMASLGEGDGSARQGIFATLAQCLPRAADFRPTVLIIDDLHFADEATLLLLRVLAQRKKIPLLVCGSSMELLKLNGEEDASPLERFCTVRQAALELRRVALQPLQEEAISEHLKTVFPRLRTPEGFIPELAGITGGNPLFLGEIIRKLVNDGRASLVGQEWVIDRLEEGYLPRSIEEIVMQKIADLDEEGRDLLERATTLGEDVSLSVLTGSTEMDETKVLEFLDRAEALGLVSVDFQVNDEMMRFLGKRVLEISYGAMDGDRREELHERVGTYQEGLYQKRLLPSASLLAYHFKRSANDEKARRYEQVQLDFSKSVFDADEAANYTTEVLEGEEEEERRLDPHSVPRVPYVLRTLMSAVRNIQLYPPESKTIADALRDVHEALEVILDNNERLHLSQAQRVLLANGQRLDIARFHMLASSFLKLLTRLELQGIVFQRGVTREEIRRLLMALGTLRPELIDQGFWRSFSLEEGLEQIELRQVRYSRMRRKKGRITLQQPVAQEQELGPQELTYIPKIIRLLQGAAQNARLYPMDSKPVTRSLEQLLEALNGVLNRHPVLTLARADRSLLVNGARVDTTGYAPLAASLVELLDSAGINSITFSANIPQTELHMFIDALRSPQAEGVDGYYWEDFAKEKGLSCLAFNQRPRDVGGAGRCAARCAPALRKGTARQRRAPADAAIVEAPVRGLSGSGRPRPRDHRDGLPSLARRPHPGTAAQVHGAIDRPSARRPGERGGAARSPGTGDRPLRYGDLRALLCRLPGSQPHPHGAQDPSRGARACGRWPREHGEGSGPPPRCNSAAAVEGRSTIGTARAAGARGAGHRQPRRAEHPAPHRGDQGGERLPRPSDGSPPAGRDGTGCRRTNETGRRHRGHGRATLQNPRGDRHGDARPAEGVGIQLR